MADKNGGDAPKPEKRDSDPQTAPAESKAPPQKQTKTNTADSPAPETVKEKKNPPKAKKSQKKTAPASAADTSDQKTDTPTEKKMDEGGSPRPSPEKCGDLRFYPELRNDLPDIHPGDIINIAYLIQEGGKDKTQNYQGTVIALNGAGITRTMTVRKISFGVGVERIFPLNSKYVQKVEIVRRSRVRRSKLYYLRKLRGKASRLKPLK